MTDVNLFMQGSGLLFQPGRLIDDFMYMDNRSWTYPK
jgi:hypothetical protein